MKILILFLTTMFLTSANAQNVQRFDRFIKLPWGASQAQGVFEVQEFSNLAAASQGYAFASFAANTSTTAVTKSTGITNPDSPRNVVIIPDSNTSHVNSCAVVVTGTDILGNTITETHNFVASASAVNVGSAAFKTVTSVAFPANCEVSPFDVTWSVGIGEKIGLKRCMDETGAFIQSSLNGTIEGTRATLAASAASVKGNTADFNGAMNGSNDFKAYYIQNHRCY